MTGPVPARQGAAALTLAGWTAFLAVAVAALHAVGGALAPPPLTDPGGLGDWLDQRQAAEAAFAVLRLVALGMAWYLLVVTIAGAVARMTGWRSLVRALDSVTVPAVRRLVAGAAGASLAAAAFTGGGGTALAEAHAMAPATPSAVAETMRRLPDAPPGAGPTAPVTAPPATVAGPGRVPPGTVPVMRRLPASPPDSSATSPASTTPPSAPPSQATRAAAAPDPPLPPPGSGQGPAAAGRTWQVVPGDHFWAVAERVLAEAWERSPTDDEVDPYWRALVQANAAVLADPANPDLLFPGQVIAVPAPPPRPA